MVKAEAKRDYYADLDLQYGATPEDIKKQFRKLAKIYHPDRNPGREVEFNAKFQAIQAANEVLTDPEQRLRYDQERIKAGYNNIYANPLRPTGPLRPTTTHFPPPPRRTATTREPRSTYNPTGAGVHKAPPSAGAQRYAPWARAGAQSWEKTKEEAQTRADAFRGFQEMKSGPGRGIPHPPPHPPAGRARYVPFGQRPASGVFPPPPQEPPKPTKSWDHVPTGQGGFPGMSRTQGSRRKPAGFDPSTPGGDEHMAGRSAYAEVSQGSRQYTARPQSSYFDTESQPTSPQQTFAQPTSSPLRHARSHEDASKPPRPGLGRNSTKYATSGGEKLNMYTSGLGRSASVRNSPIDPQYEDHTPPRPHSHHGTARFRSASPGLRNSAPTEYDSESSSSESSDEEPLINSARPKATAYQRLNKTQTAPHYKSANIFEAAGGVQHQYKHTVQSSQLDHTATYQYPPPPPQKQPHLPDEQHGGPFHEREDTSQHVHATGETYEDNPKTYGTLSPSFSRKWRQVWGFLPPKGSTGAPCRAPPLWAMPSSILPEQLCNKTEKQDLETLEDESSQGQTQPSANISSPSSIKPHSCSKANKFDNCSSSSAHATISSTNNLPGAFSASEWNGKFDSAEDLFAPTASQNRRSPSKGTRSSQSQSRGRTTSPGKDHVHATQGNPNQSSTATAFQAAKFDPEKWVNEASSQSSTATAFQPPKFDADKWAEDLKDQTWSVPITDPTRKTPKRGSKSTAKRPSHAKHPNVTSEHNGNEETPIPSTHDSPASKHTGAGADEMEVDSPAEPATVASNGVRNTNIEMSSNANPLDELRRVHPFEPSSTGLGDLDDLSTCLPFESRPAQHLNLNDPSLSLSGIKHLNLPKPPKAPVAPMEESLSPGRWLTYVNQFSAYMKEWSQFNKEILEHFNIRQARTEYNMASNWISSVGDGPTDVAALEKGSSAQAGYKTYENWCDQDAAVREWWNVANERHREAIADLGGVRERMKKANGRTK